MNLNLTGKVLFAAIAAAVLGDSKTQIKLKGRPEDIKAFADVIKATKEFQEEVKNPNATVESVMEKLKAKYLAGKAFEACTGVTWPL